MNALGQEILANDVESPAVVAGIGDELVMSPLVTLLCNNIAVTVGACVEGEALTYLKSRERFYPGTDGGHLEGVFLGGRCESLRHVKRLVVGHSVRLDLG